MRTNRLTLSLALTLGLAGCKSTPPAQPAPIVDMNNGADPALANLAPVDPNAPNATPVYSQPTQTNYPVAKQPAGRVLGYRSEPNQTAPASEQYYDPQQTNDQAYDQYDAQYDAQANAGQDALQDSLYADQAPPPLPVYDQPVLTQVNDQWTPGYWNYASQGYYFVPGAWVAPPYTGALWTPGYWGYEGRRYRFHRGFWGRHIGFYGGVNYGFGYVGRGYEGGYWNNNNFYYNQRVNRINIVDVRNVYSRNVTVVSNEHYSYNGPGGYQARPVAAELAVYREQRLPPQQAQLQIRQQAATNRQQFFAENHGRPAVFAAPQRFNADAQQARPIQPVQRGGFGQPGVGNQQQQLRAQQVQQQQQQVQQRNLQQQQQRTNQAEQRNAQQQQHVQQQQQQNAQRQQQEQQRTQQLQQRNTQQQQRASQLQQRDAQAQTAQQQQRIQAQQQHNQAAQQQNVQRQQVQVQQQRTQQNAQAQQQRAQQEQQRSQQLQQRTQQEQQRTQQIQQRTQQDQQRTQPVQQRVQPTPQQQPRTQQVQQRPQPAPQPAPQREAPRPQPAAPAPAPRPQPAAAPPAPRPQPAPQPRAEPARGPERPR